MFSHVCVGVSDTARAYDFYAPLFAELGLRLKFREPDGWSGWMPADTDRPLFFFGRLIEQIMLRVTGNWWTYPLFYVAALVVSPWGLSKHPVWTSVELYKVFCAVVAFLIWAVVGWFTLRQSQQRWWLAALCPAGIALLIAAMSAEGSSRIHNIEQIDRGYQDIERRLNAIGARITRI